jgi:hypothetical protein
MSRLTYPIVEIGGRKYYKVTDQDNTYYDQYGTQFYINLFGNIEIKQGLVMNPNKVIIYPELVVEPKKTPNLGNVVTKNTKTYTLKTERIYPGGNQYEDINFWENTNGNKYKYLTDSPYTIGEIYDKKPTPQEQNNERRELISNTLSNIERDLQSVLESIKKYNISPEEYQSEFRKITNLFTKFDVTNQFYLQ